MYVCMYVCMYMCFCKTETFKNKYMYIYIHITIEKYPTFFFFENLVDYFNEAHLNFVRMGEFFPACQ